MDPVAHEFTGAAAIQLARQYLQVAQGHYNEGDKVVRELTAILVEDAGLEVDLGQVQGADFQPTEGGGVLMVLRPLDLEGESNTDEDPA